MRRITIFAIAALLIETGDAKRSVAIATDPSFYVLSPLERAMPGDPPPVHPRTAIAIAAARGETQAAQIVIHGGATGLRALDVALAGALKNERGASIHSSAVKFYLEHYLAISSPSAHGLGGARAGTYPDALVPFFNPFTHARLAGPFAAAAGQNQPVYVEIAVPENAAAGIYKGVLDITSGGRAFAAVPLSLTVWNFAIPKQSSMQTSFQDYDNGYDLGAGKYYGYAPGSPEHASMARAMDAVLLEHRVANTAPFDGLFRVNPDGHIAESAADNRRILEIVTRQPDFSLSFGAHFPFADPLGADRQKAITYLRDAWRWFDSRGLSSKVFLRTNDEPHSDAEFRQTRDFADLIHQANPKFRVAITGGMDSPGYAKYLFGHVDVFVICAPFFDPVRAREQISRGAELWSYNAVVQNLPLRSPHWQTDFPLLHFRIMPWINYRYGLRGLLYWTSAYWNDILAHGHSPWSDPCSLKGGVTCFNGDGLLIYPGKDVDYVVPKSVYGSAVWGPIPSLRLKAIRDGLEDYELLLLAARRDPEAAMNDAIAIGCSGNSAPGDAKHNCFHDWNPDPSALIAMRDRLAALILSHP